MAKKPEPASPFAGVDRYTIEDVTAIQALDSGRDVPGYVAKRALTYIIETLCCVYDQSYRPSSDRDTAFVEGRRFPGLQLLKLLKLNPQQLRGNHARDRDPGRDPGRNPDAERAPERT